MALLYQPRFRAMDDNGVPMPFAELYTRDSSATTTPKVTYSDPDLDVSHENTNPLVADAGGWFGQMYAATDEQFYIILTEADGDPNSPFKVYADVSALGGDNSTSFTRSFAGGRLTFKSGDVEVGLSGIVMQYGAVSPDDVGGAVLEQGWNGTQGDKKITDFAVQEFTGDVEVAGTISAEGLEITGNSSVITLLSSGSATHAAGIALPAGFSAYRLEIAYLTLSSSASIEAFFAFDGVPTYKTGADDYTILINWNGSAGAGTAANAIDISDARMALMNTEAAITGINPGRATIEITSSALLESGIAGSIWLPNDNGSYSPRHGLFSGQTRGKTYGKATHFKLSPSSGTMAYRYALFGIPGL